MAARSSLVRMSSGRYPTRSSQSICSVMPDEARPVLRPGGDRHVGPGPDHDRLGVVPVARPGRDRHPRARTPRGPCPPWPPWWRGCGPASRTGRRAVSPAPPSTTPGAPDRSPSDGRPRTGPGSGAARRHSRSSQAWRLYPANSSSPPSPESATVTSVRASWTDQLHGDLRDVTERLVPDVGQAGDDRGGVGIAQPGARVWSVPRWAATAAASARLVEGPLGEADGEGPDRPVAVLLHERDDEARVDPSGQEGADRHVGDHAVGHRVGQDGLQLVGERLGRVRPAGGRARRSMAARADQKACGVSVALGRTSGRRWRDRGPGQQLGRRLGRSCAGPGRSCAGGRGPRRRGRCPGRTRAARPAP